MFRVWFRVTKSFLLTGNQGKEKDGMTFTSLVIPKYQQCVQQAFLSFQIFFPFPNLRLATSLVSPLCLYVMFHSTEKIKNGKD
jgi:hypothetical protein